MNKYKYMQESKDCLAAKHRNLSCDITVPAGTFRLNCDFICPAHSFFREAAGYHHVSPPFARLFVVIENGAWITMDGIRHRIEEGDIVLLPAAHPFFADYDSGSRMKAWHLHLYDGLGFSLSENLPTLQKYRQEELFRAVSALAEDAPEYVTDPLTVAALTTLLAPEFPAAVNRLAVSYPYRKLITALNERPPATVRLEDFCRDTGLSRSALGKGFKRCFGITFKEYQHNILLAKARIKLLDRERNISQIAEELGFGRVFYFIDFFRRATGESPGAYRKKPLQ